MEILVDNEARSLVGQPPLVGEELPHFKVLDQNGAKVKTRDLIGQPLLISVVPDITTGVCTLQTRHFNEAVSQMTGVKLVTISVNTPEQQANWCAAEGLPQVELLSDQAESFGYAMKLFIPDEGVDARSVFVVDATGKITYEEIVPVMGQEPDYKAALAAVEKLG